MNRYFEINGKRVDPERIKEYSSHESWEKDLFSFIETWFKNSEVIHSSTSGSTGKAKEIKLKKKDMLLSAGYTLDFLGIKKGESALLCLPTQFVGGKMMVIRSIKNGLNLIAVEPSSDPLKELNEVVDFVAITPHQLNNILLSPDSTEKLKSIRNVIVGGSAPSNDAIKVIRDFPNNIWSTFGMTESISHFAMSRLNSEEPTKYELISGDFSIEVDEDSRLILNSPFNAGERLYTNDLIEKINENSFRWKGRYDNIINSGGIKFSPEEIESKIRHLIHDEFIVSSKEDNQLGERVVLIIEGPHSKESYSDENFKSSLSSVLEKYELPKEILLLNEFPRVGNDKVDRRSLRDII